MSRIASPFQSRQSSKAEDAHLGPPQPHVAQVCQESACCRSGSTRPSWSHTCLHHLLPGSILLRRPGAYSPVMRQALVLPPAIYRSRSPPSARVPLPLVAGFVGATGGRRRARHAIYPRRTCAGRRTRHEREVSSLSDRLGRVGAGGPAFEGAQIRHGIRGAPAPSTARPSTTTCTSTPRRDRRPRHLRLGLIDSWPAPRHPRHRPTGLIQVEARDELPPNSAIAWSCWGAPVHRVQAGRGRRHARDRPDPG